MQAEEFNGQFTDVFSKTSESEVPLLEKSAKPMSDIHISNDITELAVELGPVFAHLFQQSLDKGEIPKEWSYNVILYVFDCCYPCIYI